MATKTKTGGGTLALVLCLIVGAGFFYGLSNRGKDDDKERAVHLLIMFEPAKRLTFVNVTVTLNGAIVVNNDKTKNSPWESEVMMRRGQTVVLTATQTVASKLSCAVNGIVQETNYFVGLVVCRHTIR